MSSVAITSPASQPRYQLLDGLRGVAAFVVIFYHFGEGFATSAVDQFMNHGYLAVDFFFVLSGFVLGYAYDGRWAKGKMTAGNFMLRRVIRLQPMVVLGALLGLAAYIVQGCVALGRHACAAVRHSCSFSACASCAACVSGYGSRCARQQ